MRTLLLYSFLLLSASLSAQNIEGRWRGMANIDDIGVEFVFNFIKSDSGYDVTVDIPTLESKSLHAENVTFDGDSLSLYVKSIDLLYTARYLNGSLIGIFDQSRRLSSQLNLTRDHEEGRKMNRPQEPAFPLPYRVEEIVFSNPDDKVQLSGTLTIPKGNQPSPIIILIPGFSATNRDSELFQHKPFLVLSDYLTRNGYMVFRYDPRGRGESDGNNDALTLETIRDDVKVAIDYLKNRKDVLKDQIGLIGHNEGGTAALLVASQKSIAFTVTLAASSVKGDNAILSAIEAQSVTSSIPFEAIKRNIDATEDILSRISASDSLTDRLRRECYLVWSKYYSMSTQQVIEKSVNQYMTEKMYNYIKYNPYSDISAVKSPVLALNGSKDVKNVSNVHLPVIENALLSGGNKNFKVMELEGLNNLFQRCNSGDQFEYLTIEETINQEVLDIILDWINSLR